MIVTPLPLASKPRARRRVVVVATLVLALLALIGCTPEQQAALNEVNATRRAAGLTELLPSPHAMAKAQAWAEQLARNNGLSHSQLAIDMPGGWRMLGENVGSGPSIAAVHQGFLNSPHHRENIMNPAWQWLGTGVAVAANGTVYVVQVFARY